MTEKDLYETIGRLYINGTKSSEVIQMLQKLVKEKDSKIKELEDKIGQASIGKSNS
jgi:hypothetical protein